MRPTPSSVQSRLSIWLVLLVSLGLSAPSTASSPGEEPYRDARRAVDQDKWQVAVKHLHIALAERPDAGGKPVRLYGVNFEPYLPYYYLAVAFDQLGDPQQAWRFAQESDSQGAVHKDESRSDVLKQLRRRLQELMQTVPPKPAKTGSDGGPPLPPPPPTRPGDVTLPAGHALVVGMSNYRHNDAWAQLPGVSKDVPAVAGALRSHGFQVDVLMDPSREQLVQRLEDLFFGAAEATRLIFYYAGHGYTLTTNDDERGYLVPVDAPHPKRLTREFQKRALSLSRFQQWVDESSARHIMFLFDSCFSGSIFKIMRGGPGSAANEDKIRNKSRLFIAAGAADQEVPDQSYFRVAFIDALNGAGDRDGDGVLFGAEIGEHIRREVINHVGLEQTPRFGHSSGYGDGDFPFVLSQ